MNLEFYAKESNCLNDGKIKVKVLGDSGEVFYEIAQTMVSTIEKNNSNNEMTVFILPNLLSTFLNQMAIVHF